MTDFTVAKDHLVYVLFRDSYGRPPVYYGVYSSPELAEACMRVLEIADFGYAHDYVIRAVRLDSGE